MLPHGFDFVDYVGRGVFVRLVALLRRSVFCVFRCALFPRGREQMCFTVVSGYKTWYSVAETLEAIRVYTYVSVCLRVFFP